MDAIKRLWGRIDGNVPWKVYRHFTSLLNLLSMAWPYLAIAYASVGAFGTFVHSLPLVVWICLCCAFTIAVLALVWRKDSEASRLRAGEFPDSSDHINGSSAVKRFGAIALLILLALGYFLAIPKQAESVEENRLARAESPSSAEAYRPTTKEPTTRLNPSSTVPLANGAKNSPEASNAVSDESKSAGSQQPNMDGVRFGGVSVTRANKKEGQYYVIVLLGSNARYRGWPHAARIKDILLELRRDKRLEVFYSEAGRFELFRMSITKQISGVLSAGGVSSGGLLRYFSDDSKDVAKEIFESMKDLGELRLCQRISIPLSEDWSIQREIWVESGIDIEIIL